MKKAKNLLFLWCDYDENVWWKFFGLYWIFSKNIKNNELLENHTKYNYNIENKTLPLFAEVSGMKTLSFFFCFKAYPKRMTHALQGIKCEQQLRPLTCYIKSIATGSGYGLCRANFFWPCPDRVLTVPRPRRYLWGNVLSFLLMISLIKSN